MARDRQLRELQDRQFGRADTNMNQNEHGRGDRAEDRNRKRAPSRSPTTTPFEKKRRVTTSSAPATFKTLRRLQRQYRLMISIKQLTGLCAYLSVALDHGYPLSDQAYDLFVTSHSTFSEEQATSPSLQRVSYHTWLIQRQPQAIGLHQVITREILGAIAEENPYTFNMIDRRLNKLMNTVDLNRDSV
ncbi:uncharacterized protein A1O5_09727 [Cladophialophora psammophila CBS 110553]|uniref:Uncharacterized protein n=1 Tax=Cladophialophora psammophila CBS 110553 TaxID=1182543 RepID=W9WQY5_9EURO|nr:uncharacterized protein A1O5_09727 [Cladophialophora psammophila CBS 110553]EXJ67081.1 hypothetical protein A1O5_09727 [Cladophialophora psammophila CBS 110553]